MHLKSIAVAVGVILLNSMPCGAFSAPTPGAATPETLKIPDGPNSIHGLVDIPDMDAFTGQVKQRIPLELPEGRAGFGPALTLVYDGGMGNSALGVGWRLDIPVIRRVLRFGVPSYGDDDVLEVAGGEASGRLVSLTPSEWRIEAQGNRYRVVREGRGFRLCMPSGVQQFFGLSEEQTLADGERIAEWHLTKMQDVAGQEIAFSYERIERVPYLNHIVWGPDDLFSADLEYENRPDTVVTFRMGFKVEMQRRLHTIAVHASGELHSTTVLTYDNSFSLSRLGAVAVTGRGGAGSWPVVSLTYVQPSKEQPRATPLRDFGGWSLNKNGVNLLDVDGDGLVDLYQAQIDGHQYRANKGDGSFAEPVAVPNGSGAALGNARLIDLVGAYRPMLVSQADGTWRARSLTSKADGTRPQWQSAVSWKGTAGVPILGEGIAFCDLNGDGRVDVLKATGDGVSVWLAGDGHLSDSISRPRISSTNPKAAPGSDATRPIDANGDGLADFIWLSNETFELYLGHGDGTFELFKRANYPWPGSATRPADVLAVDFNRDGLVDLARVSAGHIEYYRGKPGFAFDSAIAVERPENADSDVVVSVADMNGNGSTDFVWSSPRGLWTVDLAGSAAVGSLETIRNGLGATFSFAYLGSAQLMAIDKLRNEGWSRVLPVSVPILTEVAIDPGGGGPVRRTLHHARDGFWDSMEHQFGGFLTAITIKPPGSAEHPIVALQATRAGGRFPASPQRKSPPWLRGMLLAALLAGAVFATLAIRRGAKRRLVFAMTGVAIVALGLLVAAARRTSTARSADLESNQAASLAHRSTALEQAAVPVAGDPLVRDDVAAGELRETTSYIEGIGPDRVLRGKVASLKRQAASGEHVVILDETVNEYAALDVSGGAAGPLGRRAFVTAETFRSYEGSNQPISRVTRHTPDAQARARMTLEEGRTDLSGDERQTETVYADGDSPWIRDVVIEQSVAQQGTVVEHQKFYFGDDKKVEAFGVVGRGWPRREDGYLKEGALERWLPLTARTFDAFGNVTSLYRDGHSRTLSLDPEGLHVVAETLSPDGQRSLTWHGGWDPVLDVLTSVTDPAGVTTHMTYDELGRLRTIAHGDQKPHVEYVYDWAARPVRNIVHAFYGGIEQVTDRSAAWTEGQQWSMTTTYSNGLGEELFRSKRLSASRSVVLDWSERDARGRVIKNWAPFQWDDAEPPTAVPPGVAFRGAEYDALDRQTRHVLPQGTIRSIARKPFEETVNVTGLAPVTSRLDGLDRVIYTERTIDSVTEVAEAKYDARDRITQIDLDHGRASHEYVYDTLGRLRRSSDSDGGPRALEYYDSGWLKSHTNAKGQTVSFSYDAIGRIATVKCESGQYTYHYDSPKDPLHDGNCATRPCWIEEPKGIVELAYDVAGNLFTFRRTIGSASATEMSRFGASGLLLGVAWDEAPEVAYQYDRAERLTEMGEFRAVLERNPAGDVRVAETGNGVKTVMDYDSIGLAKSVRVASKTGGVLLDVSATRHPFGSISEITDNDSVGLPHRMKAGADAGGRLSSFNAGASLQEYQFAYAYDALQNMTLRTWSASSTPLPAIGGTYRYDDKKAPRRLTSVRSPAGDSPFTYDDVGRITGGAGFTLEYDALDRLRKATNPSHTMEYLYGYDGTRVTSIRDGALDEVHWTQNIVERGGVRYFYLRDAQQTVARIGPHHEATYFHYEFAPGPSLITGDGGKVVEERLFEPFGAPLTSSEGTVDWGNDRVNGLNKDTDPITGFSDHGARWMMPQLGRWLSTDPAVHGPDASVMLSPWDLNPYQYVRQNPTALWDPNGAGAWESATSAMVGFREGLLPAPFNGPRLDPGPDLFAYRLGFSVGMTVGFGADLVGVAAGGAGFIGGAGVTVGSGGAALVPGMVVSANSAALAAAAGADAISRIARAAQFEMRSGSAPNSGGRLGSPGTREHVAKVADEMEARGWDVTHGGGRTDSSGKRLPEEYLPGPGGGRKGSSYPDITATKNGKTLRVNTVDTRADGKTLTTREANNAARIRQQTGGHVLTVPKPKE